MPSTLSKRTGHYFTTGMRYIIWSKVDERSYAYELTESSLALAEYGEGATDEHFSLVAGDPAKYSTAKIPRQAPESSKSEPHEVVRSMVHSQPNHPRTRDPVARSNALFQVTPRPMR
jgi:hypothetical protein